MKARIGDSHQIGTSVGNLLSRVGRNSGNIEMSAGVARARTDSLQPHGRVELTAAPNGESLARVTSFELQSLDDLVLTCSALVIVVAAALSFADGPRPVLTMLLSCCVVLAISLIEPYAVSIASRGTMTVDSLISRQVYDLERIVCVGAVRNFEGGWKIRLVSTDGKIRHFVNIVETHEFLLAVHEAKPNLKIDPWPSDC